MTPNQVAIGIEPPSRTDPDISANLTQLRLGKHQPNRKNALFYKTAKGAQVGDTFMSLIHTCSLIGANPFDYLTALQKHATALSEHPEQWMPWNYAETLARIDSS